MPRARWMLMLAGASLALYYSYLQYEFPNLILPLGAGQMVMPGFVAFGGLWFFWGTIVALALTAAFVGLLGGRGWGARFATEISTISDRRWIAIMTLIAGSLAVGMRLGILRGMALTDDEASYRFAAQLIASGRLSIPSPAMKLFFDHPFLTNDGRIQSIYFLGWPVLAAPGVWLGVVGYVNAVLASLTVPAVFLVARERLGVAAARVCSLLFATSPFLVVLAATELSHTSCIFALAWTAWFLLRCKRPDASGWSHAGMAASFSLAFWIRPQAAVGIGGAMLVYWLMDRVRQETGRWRAIAAFAAPTVLFAGLFLAAQAHLHGSPWRPGYEHARAYHLANNLRFTAFDEKRLAAGPMDLNFTDPDLAASAMSTGLFRLGIDLLGWPIGLAGLALAVGYSKAGRFWGFAIGGLAVLAPQRNGGIDSFGPVHWAEMALPVIWLTGAAFARSAELTALRGTEPRSNSSSRWLPISGLVALVVTAWSGFVPIRWNTLDRITSSIVKPYRAAEATIKGRAIVFAQRPFIPCMPTPVHHFRFNRPIPDPDLEDRVIWLNHVSLKSDREFSREFANRASYLLVWRRSDCSARVVTLDEAEQLDHGSGRRPETPSKVEE